MRAWFRRVMPNPTSIDPAAQTGWKRRDARARGRKEIPWPLFASWRLCGLALNDFDFSHGGLPLLFLRRAQNARGTSAISAFPVFKSFPGQCVIFSHFQFLLYAFATWRDKNRSLAKTQRMNAFPILLIPGGP